MLFSKYTRIFIIAGVLIILGCISGVYVSGSSSGGYKASGLSASIAQEATSVPSKATTGGSGGAAGARSGRGSGQPGIASSIPPVLSKFQDNKGIQDDEIKAEDVKKAYEQIKENYNLPRTFSTTYEGEKIKKTILDDIKDKKFEKALVELYLWINKEALQEHLLGGPGIQGKVPNGIISDYEVGRLLRDAESGQEGDIAKVIREAIGKFIECEIKEKAGGKEQSTSVPYQQRMHPALTKLLQQYDQYTRNPNPVVLEIEKDIKSISIPHEDVKKAYEQIKENYNLPRTFSTTYEGEKIKKTILGYIESKEFEKALVELYLWINKEALQEHLLGDPGIQGEAKRVFSVAINPHYLRSLLAHAKNNQQVAKLIREAVGKFIESGKAFEGDEYEVCTVDAIKIGRVTITTETTVRNLIESVREGINSNPSLQEMRDNLNKEDKYALVISNGDKIICGNDIIFRERDKRVSELGLDRTQNLQVSVRDLTGYEAHALSR